MLHPMSGLILLACFLFIQATASAADPNGRVEYTCPFGHSAVTFTNIVGDEHAVYVQQPVKSAFDGNCYLVKYDVATNTNSNVQPGENELVDQYNAILATNRWPTKRSNIELSLDGGTNFNRRLAIGLQRSPNLLGGEFVWSLPMDPLLLSENAVFRLTDLDGKAFEYGPTNLPGRPRPGDFPTTLPFSIRGAYVTKPSMDQIVYFAADMTVSFFETGGGPTWDIGWITEADPHFHILATASNVVGGVINTATGLCIIPVAQEVRLDVWSHADRNLHGYSSTFSVE